MSINNRALLDMIGEIDALQIESSEGKLTLSCHIGDKKIALIENVSATPEHCITRIEIARAIEKFYADGI